MSETKKNGDYFMSGKKTSENLTDEFAALLGNFSGDEILVGEIRGFVIAGYEEKHRVYHNLSHIAALLYQAENMRGQIKDWQSFNLAIWFHDVIYEPKSSKNEVKSAKAAVEKLSELNVPEIITDKVRAMILATRDHQPAALDEDGKLFLDLDLSILGAESNVYENYSTAIRREYSFVPWFLYRRSRRKILENFLNRDYLYFTADIRNKFEMTARVNVANEIKKLS